MVSSQSAYLDRYISLPVLCLHGSAPDTGPHAFSTTSTMTAILFHWLPPVQPNGVITRYTLTVQQIKTVHLNSSTMSELVCGFQPGQLIGASISASTEEGNGPEVDIEAVTSERGELICAMFFCHIIIILSQHSVVLGI